MFNSIQDFYPTSKSTAYKLFNMFYEVDKNKFYKCKNVLEPSAGKGDLIEAFYDFLVDKEIEIYESFNNKTTDIRRQKYYNREKMLKEKKKEIKISVIEIDETLRNVLIGKDYNLVGRDFLNFEPPSFYDLIISNVPFSDGVHHLLKQIRIQERLGGAILTIINAETIKNTYSKERKILVEKLKEYNAKIEYLKNEFSDAERKTNVEIAMIYIDIPMKDKTTLFEKEFNRLNEEKININDMNEITRKMNPLERLCNEFKICRNNIIKLYEEKIKIEKLFDGLGIDTELGIVNSNRYTSQGNVLDVNGFIQAINKTYWSKFIKETDLRSKLPSELKNTFNKGMEAQQDVEFNIENVRYFYEGLLMSIPESFNKCVADVYNKLTNEYNYTESQYNKCVKVHYVNSWKTNKISKIEKKSIIPLYTDYMYNVPEVLNDLNIIFNDLSNKKYDINKKEIIQALKNREKNIDTEFFTLTAYSKSLHIVYKDQELLKRFNFTAMKGSNLLGNNFNKKKYKDMNEEEKEIIKFFGFNEFEYDELNNNSCINLLN